MFKPNGNLKTKEAATEMCVHAILMPWRANLNPIVSDHVNCREGWVCNFNGDTCVPKLECGVVREGLGWRGYDGGLWLPTGCALR